MYTNILVFIHSLSVSSASAARHTGVDGLIDVTDMCVCMLVMFVCFSYVCSYTYRMSRCVYMSLCILCVYSIIIMYVYIYMYTHTHIHVYIYIYV